MMKGLDLSRSYYEAFGRPMLESQFADVLPYLAVGLAGSGSECMGYDDEVSRDHDFEPGFCLFLPGEDLVDRKTAFALERAYARLPAQFEGVRRDRMAPVGGSRHGVIRTADFFMDKTGSPDGMLSLQQWLTVPSQSLAEAVSGEIFEDPYGEVSLIRRRLAAWPEDIRRKKMAGHLLLMAQSGQYNYARCLAHGETAAAQLAVFAFVSSAMEVIFLLNRTYMPFYKWRFRAMRELAALSLEAELMEYLVTSDNEPSSAQEKQKVIEDIAADIIGELERQSLTRACCSDLEKHAVSVNDGIRDAQLRNMHILAGI